MAKKQPEKRNSRRAQEQLAAIVKFAEDSLRQPLPADVERLLTQLLFDARPWLVPVGRRYVEELRRGGEWLAAFHSDLRAFFRAVLEVRQHSGGAVETSALSVRVGAMELSVVPVTAPGRASGAALVLTARGQIRDMLWFQTMNLLNAAGIDRLLVCECGRVFAKTGRREFCSVTCQKRVYMRALREQERIARRKESRHGRSARTR